MNDKIINLANFISLTRALSSYFLYYFVMNDMNYSLIILSLYVVISDFLDGYFARKNGASKLGKWLDPVADALAVFVMVIGFYFKNLLPIELIIFWDFRYLYFVFYALFMAKFRFRHVESSLLNKLSIILLVIFLFYVWIFKYFNIYLACIVILLQIITMIEAGLKILAS